jgi:hypothetical protein
MTSIRILAILCIFTPAIALAQDGHRKPDAIVVARGKPAPSDIIAPGILRQDLFDRRNPNNLRHDYPAPPGQPG